MSPSRPSSRKPHIRPHQQQLAGGALPESLLLEAISLTADGVGIFDTEDRMVFCNTTQAALFGCTPDEAVGRTFAELVRIARERGRGLHVEAADLEEWIAGALKKRRSSPYRSFQVDTQEGRWFQLTEQLTRDGYMVVWCTDITRHKENELHLRELAERLRYQAETDQLTGINNRHNFFRLAEREMSRSRRNRTPVALLLMDVDHFKQINDCHGHQTGDRVLRGIAGALSASLRAYDVLGRVGGEEFAALVSGLAEESVLQLAERLRQAVASLHLPAPLEATGCTISVGIAFDPEGSTALDVLFSHADRALYRAKAEGRNRCCWSG